MVGLATRARILSFVAGLAGCAAGAYSYPLSSFGASVVTYSPGTGSVSGYNDPSTALGEPTRYTGVGVFPGAVTPFNPAYLATEIVSIGRGGSLTLAFDHPVLD